LAFGLPHAVVDGNVLRVIARVQNDAADIGSAVTRRRFREIAESWLDRRQPGLFNQALMELGATVCLPKKPLCLECPLDPCCRARQAGTSAELPIKLGKKAAERIAGVLLLVRRAGRILLRQRPATDRRMADFWELPAPEHLPSARIGRSFGAIRHTITHHHYTLEVVAAQARLSRDRSPRSRDREGAVLRWFLPSNLPTIPLSTTARKALKLAAVIR